MGVPLYASDKEIRKAFIELSKKYHPDANANDKTLHDKFVKINRAYNVLISAEERKIYDEGLRAGLHVEPDEVSTKQNWNPDHPQYYYHPRFYKDPEMRRVAARVWEKNTGYPFTRYYKGEGEEGEFFVERGEDKMKDFEWPKHLGLKAFIGSTIVMSFGLYLAYRQYRYAQGIVHAQRVRSVETYERTRSKQAASGKLPGSGEQIEEKDLTEDILAKPLSYLDQKT